jgi:hypothetical protein
VLGAVAPEEEVGVPELAPPEELVGVPELAPPEELVGSPVGTV